MNESRSVAAPIAGVEPAEPAEEHRRPFLVTLFCLLTFVGAPIGLIGDWSDPDMLRWQQVYLTFHTGIEVALCIQLWRMRRWAVVAYAVLVAIFQLVLLAARLWHPVALLVPAPAFLVLFLYMPRMR